MIEKEQLTPNSKETKYKNLNQNYKSMIFLQNKTKIYLWRLKKNQIMIKDKGESLKSLL